MEITRALLQLQTVFLLLTVTQLASGKASFRSIKASQETVINYEVFHPKIVYQEYSNEVYPRTMHLSVSSKTYNFTLILEKNELLISPNFTSLHYHESGIQTIKMGHVNCFYHGSVDGYPNWKVVMSTCNGLQGEFGDFANKEKHFHLEPVDIKNKSIDQAHALYLETEYESKLGTCGTNQTNKSYAIHDKQEFLRRHRRQTNVPCNKVRIIELVVVCDTGQYKTFREDTVQRALDITNEMDRLYAPLCIRIALVQVIVWKSGDKISVSSNPNTALARFEKYESQITQSHDVAMLFTAKNMDGNNVGIAFVGAMCHDTGSVAVIQDGGRGGVLVVGGTAAHELGHLLNMQHDDGCCSNCIMIAVTNINSPPTKWSPCSVYELNTGLSMYNLGSCLDNQPHSVVGGPVCGNAIIDDGELCDCGGPSMCNDPCCNPRTCQLATGAKCSAGPCCTDTCQFRAYGTQCRSSSGECDIAEYCAGDSSECPVDEHKHDGTPCSSNKGVCYSGSCPTHDDQCSIAYGSRNGIPECYQQLNIRKDRFGNCGSTATAYIACQPKNVVCGQLQCRDGQFQAPIVTQLLFQSAHVIDYATGNIHACASYTTLAGSDVVSPGLVHDGTKCDDGRWCVNQQCVDIPQHSCSRGSNGQICSGNGVCNNNGQCSCKVGYSGFTCQSRTSEQIGPRIWFELGGMILFNNSKISVFDVGEGDRALVCKTDKVKCCNTPYRSGEFYYPSGAKVLNMISGGPFYRNRGNQLIRLNRRSGFTSPRGVYQCEIPSEDGHMKKLFISIE